MRISQIATGLAAALAIAAVAVIVLSGGSKAHTLYAGFDSAIQMTPGQEVRVAGRPVGSISNVRLADGHALVTLKITDDSVWPLPRGTFARARWGSTTAYLGRYTELIPGPASAGPLADGAILTTRQDDTAFELDQAYRLFRGRTKTDTSALVDRLGATFAGQSSALQQGLAAAPGGLNRAADVLSALGSDEQALKTLAEAGDRTTGALAARSADLSNLVTSAAGTFDQFARHTSDEQAALDRAPGAFDQARSTLGRLDVSLAGLTGLVNRLRPGAPALERIAQTAQVTLATLRTVAPQATATLDNGSAAAPALTGLFDTGRQVLPSTSRALTTFAPMFSCIRPYAPELAGFLETWSGQLKNYDASGHYARSFPATVPGDIFPGTPLTPAQSVATSPGITYAMPRPPGLNAGHPHFMPECGYTARALDAAQDPEALK